MSSDDDWARREIRHRPLWQSRRGPGLVRDFGGGTSAQRSRPVSVFIGEGPVKSRLLELQARDNLHNVLLLPQIPITEITPYINAADIMLVPLKRDDIFTAFIPSKMFDFMACGKPIILSVNREAREILEAADGGFYLEPDDPQALATALTNLAQNPERLSAIGQRGRDYVLQHYQRDQQAERLDEILAKPGL
jgi:glycosyltransferase involved in cell wall biosynthesis